MIRGLMELDLDGTFWPETPINNNAYRYLPLLYGKRMMVNVAH